MKYSSPTRMMEGSGFHPGMIGFLIASAANTQSCMAMTWLRSDFMVSRLLTLRCWMAYRSGCSGLICIICKMEDIDVLQLVSEFHGSDSPGRKFPIGMLVIVQPAPYLNTPLIMASHLPAFVRQITRSEDHEPGPCPRVYPTGVPRESKKSQSIKRTWPLAVEKNTMYPKLHCILRSS